MGASTRLKGRMARWVACASAALCALVGAGGPAWANNRPVPTPTASVSQAPDTPLLPGHVITIWVLIDMTISNVRTDPAEDVFNMELTFNGGWGGSQVITDEECQGLVNTFLSGASPDFFTHAQTVGDACQLDAYYTGDAAHAFYSVDEGGHTQVRAPMTYLNQIASAFEDATIEQLDVRFLQINNAHCNADATMKILDEPLSVGHSSWCQWMVRQGATIPTTDDPLLEGDIEQTFFDFGYGTVGPFTDLTLPVNPFTLTPTPTQAADDSSPASASSSPRGLIIGVGATITVLALAGLAALIWALRAKK